MTHHAGQFITAGVQDGSMDMPEFDSDYAGDHKKIVVAGVLGRISPLGALWTVYSELTDATNVLKAQRPAANRAVVRRTVECDLVIDPMQMKTMHMLLDRQIKEYERMWGPIPSPEELQSRRRRDGDTGR